MKIAAMARNALSLVMRPLVAALSLALGAFASDASAADGRFLDRHIEVDGTTHAYQVYLPPGYTPAQRWPVILFLHGSGEGGSDGVSQTRVGLGPALRQFPERYPAIVLFPQAPDGKGWLGHAARIAVGALDRTVAEFSVDPDRIYLTGLSRGGAGSWRLAYAIPARFAALVVVCGFVTRFDEPAVTEPERDAPFAALAARLRHLPIRVFHGGADDVVPVAQSRQAVAALEAAGADVGYTEFPGVGHNAWDSTYLSKEVPAWLFRQVRRPPAAHRAHEATAPRPTTN